MDLRNNSVIKVNMSLPVHLADGIAADNPGLVNLLKGLCQHFTDDGTPRHAEEACNKVREELEKARGNYLQYHILHNELRELLTEQSIAAQEVSPDYKTAQFYEALQKCLAVAEGCDYLSEREVGGEEGVSLTLLGLTKDKLCTQSHQKKMVSILQPQLIPLLEERLRKKCEEIQSFHDPESSTATGGELTFAKATQLPDVLRSEKTKLEEEKKQLRLARLLRNKQCWQYYQTLREALGMLEQLITNHRLRLQADSNSITTDWLGARCQAMYLKVRLFQTKLLCAMYTPDVIEALKVTRGHLEGAIKDRQTDLLCYSQAIKSFKELGMGFDQVVSEYRELRSAIDNKKWALRELRESLATENTDILT